MGVFCAGDECGLHFLLLLGKTGRKNSCYHRLDLCPGGVDQPGADNRHHCVYGSIRAIGSKIRNFWTAFFNPQFIPQTIARTGGALLLTSLYVYFHASLTIKDCRLRDMIGSRSARPALAGAIMVTVGGLAWYYFLPAVGQGDIGRRGQLEYPDSP